MEFKLVKAFKIMFPPSLGDNYKWWGKNPNFGDAHGNLGGKYKLAWKETIPFHARFQNRIGNPCFDFFKYRPWHHFFFLKD